MNYREHVKQIAIDLSKQEGLINLSRVALCEKAGIADGSFPHIMKCTFTEFVEELISEGHDYGSKDRVVKSRVIPALRRTQILNDAVELAQRDGYRSITRVDVALAAGVSPGLVTHHFSDMQELKQEVMRCAIERGITEIVAEGLAYGSEIAKNAPAHLKKQAAMLLTDF